ncbi:hypothetical protein PG997_005606 [Apiospora hydei]|uniref:Uncharacterized protein n=1 Tax=Apiospora hydei TaxID=1337664 RepID=A0ABR1WPC6_9PEZI
MADMTVHPTTTHDQPCQSVVAPAATPTQPTELAAANAPLIPRQPSSDGAANGSSSRDEGCHLLAKLPLELRNAIYALLLPATPPQYPSSFRRYRMPASARPRFWTPAIAQTCRQVRHEVLTLYLGDNLLRVGLWVQEPWDVLYLERWLQDLGDDARLVRRFAITHQTVWADTTFTVVPDAFGVESETLVGIECDFGAPANPVSDQIPAGTVCGCPLTARLPPRAAVSVPPRTADCALTRAVYAFLALLDEEGQDAFAVPRFASAEAWGAAEGSEGALSALRAAAVGPKTAAYRRRLGLGFDGAVVSEIDFNGWRWTVYHQKWAHKKLGPAEEEHPCNQM